MQSNRLSINSNMIRPSRKISGSFNRNQLDIYDTTLSGPLLDSITAGISLENAGLSH